MSSTKSEPVAHEPAQKPAHIAELQGVLEGFPELRFVEDMLPNIRMIQRAHQDRLERELAQEREHEREHRETEPE
jgi:hypothetical protein